MRRQNQHCCTVYLLEQIYCWNLIASRPSSRKNTFDVCAFSARLTWNLFTVFISMNREKYAESLLKHVEDNKFLKFMISNNCSHHCRFFPLLRHFYISKNNFFFLENGCKSLFFVCDNSDENVYWFMSKYVENNPITVDSYLNQQTVKWILPSKKIWKALTSYFFKITFFFAFSGSKSNCNLNSARLIFILYWVVSLLSFTFNVRLLLPQINRWVIAAT